MPNWRNKSALAHRWMSSKAFLQIYGPALLITLAGFIIAYQFVAPAPPKHIVIATGRPDGAYYGFGLRYQALLAERGITLSVRETSGSIENLRLLASAEVDIAFVQSGSGNPTETPDFMSLGSLYYEPLWVFSRADYPLTRLNQLRGMRLAIGEEGSGARAVTMQLLAANQLLETATQRLDLGGRAAAEALRTGRVDAAFFVASSRSPLIQSLLTADDLALMSFVRSQAYTRAYRYLSRVVLPEGVIDLAANIPARDIALLAPAANLVADTDFHPALVDLFLQTATRIHRPGGIFEDYDQFPSPHFVDFPLSKDAQRYYEHGPSLLDRFLPFWAATLIDRMKVMLLPLLTLLIPLFKIVPPTYRWRVSYRIYRWYRELNAVDMALEIQRSAADIEEYLAELERIENDVRHTAVPLSYSGSLYNLRLHIDLLHTKVLKARKDAAASE